MGWTAEGFPVSGRVAWGLPPQVRSDAGDDLPIELVPLGRAIRPAEDELAPFSTRFRRDGEGDFDIAGRLDHVSSPGCFNRHPNETGRERFGSDDGSGRGSTLIAPAPADDS